ncbi:hypothetical protein MMC26_006793 [Xylographa opegraphella]|nr:hypothetical protein [Xylographa opegraphella]
MPDSPPKRVTRARAKADAEANPGIKTTKITTASARIAAENNTSAKAAIATKRKLRVIEQKAETEQPTGGPGDVETKVSEAPKSRGRPKRSTKESDPQIVEVDAVQRTRSRVGNNKLDNEGSEPAVKKLKSRSKSSEETVQKDQKTIQTRPTVLNVAKRITRARTTPDKSNPSASTVVKVPTVKKKVTFEETPQDDKENVIVPSGNIRKPQPKSTGLRAKPVRKPPTGKGNVGEKGADSLKDNKICTASGEITQPLSPKKVNQVAKSSSISSEDELCGDKSPLRTLSKSPVKPPMSASRTWESTISRVELALESNSPTKLSSSSILASPARRPPPSPFKDILKDSPKRINFEGLVAIPSHSQSQNLYTLKASPKKTNLGNGIPLPCPNHSQTPLKTSLFQSPARRPVSGSLSSLKPPNTIDKAHDLKVTNDFSLPVFTPSNLCSSPLRAATPKETPVKVHRITANEKDAHTVETLDPNRDELLEQEGRNIENSIQVSSTTAEVPVKVKSFPALDVLDESELPQEMPKSQCTTPPGEPTYDAAILFSQATNKFRYMAEESDSEDELQSTYNTTNKPPLSISDIQHLKIERADDLSSTAPATYASHALSSSSRRRQLHSYYGRRSLSPSKTVDFSMTPLALQLSSWLASSPENTALSRNLNQTCMPSSLFNKTRGSNTSSEEQSIPSPVKSTLFDDEMLVRDQEATILMEVKPETGNLDQAISLAERQQSEEPEEFGDENAVPIDPQLFGLQYTPRPTLETCTPSRVFQPNPREIHTVSKVPLRPAGDESPITLRRLRSKSFSDSSIMAKAILRPDLTRSNTVISYSLGDDQDTNLDLGCNVKSIEASTDVSSATGAISTPINKALSNFVTPVRTPRVGLNAQTMRGAVVFVDVHTTEGADASGIFIELLTQMGAKCVKQWTWNPHATCQVCPAQRRAPNGAKSLGKIGITHVVYKDGGKRTLEKVRESNGLVLCVGVGWVLDCERENRWLDELDYAVDTSIVPRGGQRRRKSMEPKMLANINGSVMPSEIPARVSFDLSPTKEFLNLSSPVSRRDSIAACSSEPQTPKMAENIYEGYDDGASSWDSPATPYYLNKGAELVQQTCPPKRTLQPLFPLSGRIEDQPDESVRQRLLLARRKSLQWAPKVGSPLGRAVSYGKEDMQNGGML